MKSRLSVVLFVLLSLQSLRAGEAPLASGEARAETRKAKAGPSLTVLAWNLFLRPRKLFKNRQRDRAAVIPKHLASFEVLVLSEAFDDELRRGIIAALAGSHPHVSKVVGRDQGIKQDGGVVVLSRWPIESEDAVLYGDRCEGPDCFADKGALYVRILKEGVRYHLFATHLQARSAAVRKEQLKVLREFLVSKKIPASEPVIIAGDLNVNRHGEEFATMLTTLDASCPPTKGHAFTSDPKNDLVPSTKGASFVDYVLYSNEHLRPVLSELETRIFRAEAGDLSDHYAVLGRLLFDRPEK